MADWSEIDITWPPPSTRKAQDFLPLFIDMMVFWDFVGCVAAGMSALHLYGAYVLCRDLDFSTSGPFWRDIAFGSFIAALILRVPRQSFSHRLQPVSEIVFAAERKCVLAFLLLIFVGTVTRSTDDLARLWLMGWFLLFALVVAATRTVAGLYLHRLGRRGQLREAVAVVGPAAARERIAARIAGEADVVGLFGPAAHGLGDSPDSGFEEERTLAHLMELSRHGGVHSVILAIDHGLPQNVEQLIERLKAMPVQVAVCPDDGWAAHSDSQTRLLGGVAMTVVADRPIRQWNLLVKTAIDKIVAAVLLLALMPLLLAMALAVAASGPGPVIFRQKRTGWSGRAFVIYKFRTMLVGAPELGLQTSRADPRCTKVGRILRRYSLDELPQLWNVLLGDMSLVGPRPHADVLHDIDRAGKKIIAEYALRHRVKPGLTGWAQVNGARGATSSVAQMRRRVVYDLYYIENWSLWLDIKILVRTPFSLSGENAF